jgi:hypothetical protein
MSLCIGKMGDEESWQPVKPLVRQISARRIAQIWLHHTGIDTTRGFGTKTREWEMDTVAMLSKLEDDGTEDDCAAFKLEFGKTRLKTPDNYKEFTPKIIRRNEHGFTFEETAANRHSKKGQSDGDIIRRAFINAYEHLADTDKSEAGFDGAPVKKVSLDEIRGWLKNRGYLDTNDKGNITAAARKYLHRAKTSLLGKTFVEDKGKIWRIRQ